MLGGLSLPGAAYAASPAEVVAAASAAEQAVASQPCAVRAAVARAAFRIERVAAAEPFAPFAAVTGECGVRIGVDRARE